MPVPDSGIGNRIGPAFSGRHLFRPALTLLFAVACLVPAAQGQGLAILEQGSDAPLEINARKGIEWDQTKKIYVARGKVRARQDEVTVFADQLTAHYREGEGSGTAIWRLTADGRVRIQSSSETAYGDRGVYDVDRGILVLVGRKLRLVSDSARITARDSLEYWEKRRMAVARGKAFAQEDKNKLWANVLSAYLRDDGNGKTVIQRLEAFEEVKIQTPQDVVVGDRGLYNLDSRTAILCGGVKILHEDTLLTGQVAEVNLTTGRARLRPGGCDLTVK